MKKFFIIALCLSFGFHLKAQEDSLPKYAKNYIALSYSLASTGNFLILDGENDYSINERKAVDKRAINQSFGVFYGRKINKRLAIEIGLNIKRLGHKTIKQNILFEGASGTGSAPETMYFLTETLDSTFDRVYGFTAPPAFSDYRYVVSHKGTGDRNVVAQKIFSYSYLEVPINIVYSPFKLKSGNEFYFNTGLNLAVLLNHKHKTIIDDEVSYIQEFKFSDLINRDSDIYAKPFNWGFNVGLGHAFRFSENWVLNSELNTSMYFMDFYNDYSENFYDNILELQNALSLQVSLIKTF